MDGREDVFGIGSKPVKVCQNARAKRPASWGAMTLSVRRRGVIVLRKACATMGIKLHAICGISGVIHSFDMTAANVHDLHYLKDVKWEYHDRMILGDKGYLSAATQPDLFENLVPVRAEPCRPAMGPERSRDYVNSPHHPRGSLQAQPEELATAYMG